MPDYYNNILAVTYEELVPRFYSSEKYLSKLVCIHKRKGFGIRKVQRGGGSEKQALIEFDSLPRHIRERMDDPRVGMHVLEPFYNIDGEATRFFQNHTFEDGSHIDDDIADEYVVIASVLNAVIELREARIYERKTKEPKRNPRIRIWESLSEDLNSFLSVLKNKHDIEVSLPVTHRHLQDKVTDYENDGYISLLKGHHFTQNNRKVDKKTEQLLESIFATLGHKPNYQRAYEIYTDFTNGDTKFVHNETGEVLNHEEYKQISVATVRNYLTKWESRIATHQLRSSNRTLLIGQFNPPHKMDNKGKAGSLISVDDRQPPFNYLVGDTKERVWFYLAQDPASEAFTTWVHGTTKKGIIEEFYRQMVRNYATWGLCLPAELECESNLNSSYRNTLLKPGNMFQHVRIEANNARGKYIEPGGNKKLRYGTEKEQTGWLARPHARLEANQSGADDSPILPYNDIVDIAHKAIMEHNNMPHPTHKNKTRWEVFLETQNSNLQPINWRGILPFIGKKTSTSCHTGIIRFNNDTYLLAKDGKISAGDELLKLMSLIEGEKFDVYWLDDNNGNVLKAIAYIGNQYICEIMPQPVYPRAKIEQTEADLANRTIMSKYAMTVNSFGQRRQKEIAVITIIEQKSKTLNTKFDIYNLEKCISEKPIIEDVEYTEVEVLPSLPDELNLILNNNETPVKQTMFDRF